jgi:glutaconate CoA-transferase subunit B
MSFVGGCYDKPKVRFPGGAGSATLIPVTKRTVIWRTKHDARSLVETVDFATTAANPELEFVVYTPLSVFRMKDGLLELEAIAPYSSLEEVKENTGWTIEADGVRKLAPPTEEELALIAEIDPHGIRHAEF